MRLMRNQDVYKERSEHGIRSLSCLPELIVLDLDDTLWVGDIDYTEGPPFKRRSNDSITDRRGNVFRLCPDAIRVLDVCVDLKIRIAIASRTTTPRWAEHALQLYQLSSGQSVASVAPIREMYQGSKQRHLNQIVRKSGVDRERTVFYDNEYWNITDVSEIGILSIYTPRGLTWAKFCEGLWLHEEQQMAALSSNGDGGDASGEAEEEDPSPAEGGKVPDDDEGAAPAESIDEPVMGG
ncbi:unnamed protein product [Vitrella brassicaformis CCMP3155]|uniref:FCP1 homology domain-containing protein n=1 Tax=Vitrella brassicaformis (strain CCMP3155) TaxID=1169540 RepID=A0A0G4E892_VITBC|nr:unnamed protein product [Vitrella brassicaformis CCMP3155]|eukprot:CEL91851.1 unnamed protein product [Vitrella brassicaformis CCMP3155]